MVRKVAVEAVVAATRRSLYLLSATIALTVSCTLQAGVLPEDRADALYHSYDGGGVEVDGPSILVRKGDGKRFSFSGNYYVDNITAASVDVVTQGSKYDEDRTQWSGSIDYLHADTVMSAGYTDSDEDDYKAKTASFSISQSMFGDLTTITLGYSRGWDDVYRNGDPAFDETVDRRNYRVDLDQVLTKDLLLSINYEAVTDEGFLNNPYRSVRYIDSTSSVGYSFQPEVYPDTRTSNAIAANLLYYLPYRAALGAGYRYFNDDWGIGAHTAEISYTHPLREHWIAEVGYRYYQQGDADFYSDLFPRRDAQNFMARDKELSEFYNQTLSLGLAYELPGKRWRYVDRASLNLAYRSIWFDYDNYRNIKKTSAVPGNEPKYDFRADVIHAFVSIWY